MTPRAFLIRSAVPRVVPSREAEDLGLYGSEGSAPWRRLPYLLRIDGLTWAQASALKDRARLHGVFAGEAKPIGPGGGRSEGLILSAEAASLSALARDIGADDAAGAELIRLIETFSNRKPRLRLAAGELTFDDGAMLMGVLNVTPDSFSDGGRFSEKEAAVEHGRKLAAEGARVIDVGGESTRPGATPVAASEEIDRTLPVSGRLREILPHDVHISIDTMKADVARAAVAAGAAIINDVSGLAADPAMRSTAAGLGVPVIVGHMRGRPGTMQRNPTYKHVIPEVLDELGDLVDSAVRQGIDPERIAIDPGIGFGKRVSDNVAILRHLPAFVSRGRPVVIGVSRKSFLGSVTGDAGPGSPERADATLAAETWAALGGAHIIRTHEPARAAHAVLLARAASGRFDAGGESAKR